MSKKTWKMSDQEYVNVMKLSPVERYYYTLKRAADWGYVWSLRSDGGWVLAQARGHEAIPIWPHPRYAEACANGEWGYTQPAPIPLKQFIRRWISGAERDGRLFIVFPIPNGAGVVCEPDRLKADLLVELQDYE